MTGTAGADPTILDLVLDARATLAAAGLSRDDAALDAEVLARWALGWDRAAYLARRHDPAPPAFAGAFAALVARRARREPVAQITGVREFWDLEFEVTPDVLVPRPDTELVVEEALTLTGAEPGRAWRVVDVGTGSGCLAVSIACERPAAEVVATDLSGAALAVARRNAARHGVGTRVRFVRADLLAGVSGPVDLIVANPPYVCEPDRPRLQAEVARYEPPMALFGGRDGLVLIRRLLPQARRALAPGGWLVMEFGYGQADDVAALVAELDGLHILRIRRDLVGIARTLVAARE